MARDYIPKKPNEFVLGLEAGLASGTDLIGTLINLGHRLIVDNNYKSRDPRPLYSVGTFYLDKVCDYKQSKPVGKGMAIGFALASITNIAFLGIPSYICFLADGMFKEVLKEIEHHKSGTSSSLEEKLISGV